MGRERGRLPKEISKTPAESGSTVSLQQATDSGSMISSEGTRVPTISTKTENKARQNLAHAEPDKPIGMHGSSPGLTPWEAQVQGQPRKSLQPDRQELGCCGGEIDGKKKERNLKHKATVFALLVLLIFWLYLFTSKI